MIPITEESSNAESKIESPESGDYNLHRSEPKQNVTENREYFGTGAKTGNNLQSVRVELARFCKLKCHTEEKVSGTKVP